jgi:hypothetical protein
MRHLYVFFDVHMAPKQQVLEGSAQSPGRDLMRLLPDQIVPFEFHLSFGGRMDPRNQVENGGFSRAVWPYQPPDFSGFDGQVELVHGAKTAKVMRHIGYPQQGHGELSFV